MILEEPASTRVFHLVWFDPALHEADGSAEEYERSRRFNHCGAAIAWARRQLFHGKVFGESIEMRIMDIQEYEGKEHRISVGTYDITLSGFVRWEEGYDRSAQMFAPSKKIKVHA